MATMKADMARVGDGELIAVSWLGGVNLLIVSVGYINLFRGRTGYIDILP